MTDGCRMAHCHWVASCGYLWRLHLRQSSPRNGGSGRRDLRSKALGNNFDTMGSSPARSIYKYDREPRFAKN